MKKFLHSISCAAAVAFCVSATPAFAAETVIVEADFSTLTAGSEESPELFKYSFNFTNATGLTGWSYTGSVGQAGGSLYIADGASVKSKSFSGISSKDGAIKVSAEVKLNKTDIGMVQLKWGSSSYSYTVETAEWQNIEFVIQPGYLNQATISPFLVFDGIFVKNLKIAQSLEFISAPELRQPSDANGTSFTASWKSVTGATKYLLDVYSYNAEGDKVMFLDNQECTSTSYKVEGLNPATTYYYVVRAANESGVSANSAEIEVVKYVSALAAPVVKIASCDENGNFTATWDAVADADGYSIAIFRDVTLTEAGEATVLTEDFNALTAGSLSDVEYIFDRHLAALNTPGWGGDNLYSINGAVGFNTSSYANGYLTTPELDLSANDGKFSITINMAANLYGTFKTGDVVKFATIDSDGNESDPMEVTIDKNTFADYTINLTGGAKTTKVKIYTAASNKIFIDNIEIKQLKPAGTVTTSTYLNADTDATEYTGKVEFAANTEYTFVAVATGRTVAGGEITGITSEASAPVAIVKTSGIADVTDATAGFAIAKAGHGIIAVSAATATTVEIYDIAGRLIAAVPVAEGTSTIAVQAKGIVIVKAGTAVAKLAL